MNKTPEEIIKEIVSYVGWLLLLAALGFYGYGIIEAIRQTINSTSDKPVDYPEFLSTTIGSIQALLLTNLGMLLGIAVTKPDSEVARSLKLGSKSSTVEVAPPSPMELKEKIQLFALVIYIFSLIACLIIWIIKDFETDTKLIVSVISESGKMFIGVVLAYLTAVLNK